MSTFFVDSPHINTGGDVTLQYGLSAGEKLMWDDNEGAFTASDDWAPDVDLTHDLGTANLRWNE